MAILESTGLTTTASWDFEDCWLSQDQREVAVCKGPDLLLDVPVLKIDEMDLHVEGLKARVWVTAEMVDLVRLSTGADVNLDKVDLTAKDMDVQALVNVRLDEVRAILVKALTTVSENPDGLGVEKIAVDSRNLRSRCPPVDGSS
jgi:hypothetical protein